MRSTMLTRGPARALLALGGGPLPRCQVASGRLHGGGDHVGTYTDTGIVDQYTGVVSS